MLSYRLGPSGPEMINRIVTAGSSRTLETSSRKASWNSSPSYSSSPSIISIGEGRGVGSSLRGSRMSFCSCVAAFFVGRAGSSIIAFSTCSRKPAVFMASWYARVENNWSKLSHPAKPCLKKQAYDCRFSPWSLSAIDCRSAVFPTPLRPWIKNTALHEFDSLIQRMMSASSFLRVPGRHLGGGYRAAESCRAPWEMNWFNAWMPWIQPLVLGEQECTKSRLTTAAWHRKMIISINFQEAPTLDRGVPKILDHFYVCGRL